MSELTLYTYFRSSAAYRVRIALAYKQLPYSSSFVHLVKDGGQQHSEEYKKINAQELVPALKINGADGPVLAQSMAILEYLEERYPKPPLLPADFLSRAEVRAFAQCFVADIHPLNNLRVTQYLENKLSINQQEKAEWYRHWITTGFAAIEQRLRENKQGRYCFGNNISMADVCLIPQVYNAIRFSIVLDSYPEITKIYLNCMELDAFSQAAPEQQEDCDL
ncbi:Maleylacetoacetate isomerase @ Glutathione S-transferase, zeta [hydrothermal vent metagenome]|uniref:Maleylacetoacetate isomerase @ Glutathione S-transferase, zeta n=1 Tax=hydrothermal vent metagenome TaxID=652676 RepID=A0A3B0ZA74_9ZZZZ